VWFVAERFEQLRDLLLAFGYALDPGPRDPNEWHELHYEEPPTGVVRLKGVRLRDLEDDDSDFDPEITFSIEDGKEGVWGSSPQEGLRFLPAQGVFAGAGSPTWRLSGVHVTSTTSTLVDVGALAAVNVSRRLIACWRPSLARWP
jgi:hypothetical protein